MNSSNIRTPSFLEKYYAFWCRQQQSFSHAEAFEFLSYTHKANSSNYLKNYKTFREGVKDLK